LPALPQADEPRPHDSPGRIAPRAARLPLRGLQSRGNQSAESTLEPVPPSADPCAGVLRARDPYIQPRAKEVRPSRMSPCEEMDEPANARHWPIPRVVK